MIASSFDRTYSKRYTQRNKIKMSCVLENLPNTFNSAVDIGCNAGYISEGILDTKKVKSCSGVDLKRNVVSRSLLSKNNFKFIEGDIVNLDISELYDVVIYLSVHHHVIGKYGIEKSFETWDKIINHCNNVIFFETGMMREKGTFYWKTKMKSFFKNDKVYLDSLFSRIGPRLKKVTKIKNLKIHGTERSIYKIDLNPIKVKTEPKLISKQITNTKGEKQNLNLNLPVDDHWEVLDIFYRTKGRERQKLVSINNRKKYGERLLFKKTIFYKLKNKINGRLAFGKKILNNKDKEKKEVKILQEVNYKHVIKPIEVNNRFGIIFPFYDWLKMTQINFSNISNKGLFKKELSDFFDFAKQKVINLGEKGVDKKPLIMLVDFNASNFIVNVKNNKILDWKVFDFEETSKFPTSRNRTNKQNIFKLINRISRKERKG